jgi:hypothetical protein
MAAKFRRIDPRIWKDEKFVTLSAEEKLVAFYCITAQSNRIGLFNFSPGMASEDLGMSPQTFQERFGKVRETLFWGWDSTLRVLFLPTWWKHNPPENGNVLKGCLNDLADVPHSPLIQAFLNVTRNVAETLRVTLPQTIPQTLPNSGTGFNTQEHTQETDQKPRVCDPSEKDQTEIQIPPLTVFVEAWNSTKLLPCEARSTLRANWQVRILDADWSARWQEAVKRLGRSSRARGEVSDWRATPDWFLKTPEAVARTLAGEFDDLGGDKPEPAQPKTYRPEDNPQYVNTMNAKPCPAEILTRKAK